MPAHPFPASSDRNESTYIFYVGWRRFLLVCLVVLSILEKATPFHHHRHPRGSIAVRGSSRRVGARLSRRRAHHCRPIALGGSRTITTTTTTTGCQNSPLIMGATASSAADAAADDGHPTTARTVDRFFRGKNVLITGASRGLGRSLALRLAGRGGVSTLILSGRDEDALGVVAEECRKAAAAAAAAPSSLIVETILCDLSSTDAVSELGNGALKACSGRGGTSGCVDVLINNGGISSRSSFLETKIEVDERLMQVNFLSGAALAKKVAPRMVCRGSGCIVWISTIQGKVGTPFRTSYAASKFAVQGYCEALRSELASSGVTVHVASPGYVRTNLSVSAVTGDGGAYKKMDETTSNGADPDEVACTILDSVAAGKSDFVVAADLSAKAALWLKFLAPSILEKMLVRRYVKSRIESENS